MEIVPVVKTIVKLLVVTVILHGVGLITQVDLFYYAATLTGVLMGLNTYWLSICLIAYFTGSNNQEELSRSPVGLSGDASQLIDTIQEYMHDAYVADLKQRPEFLNKLNIANGKRCDHLNGNHR